MCRTSERERKNKNALFFCSFVCVCVCVSGLFFHRVKMCRKIVYSYTSSKSIILIIVFHPFLLWVHTHFYPLFSPVFSFHFYITFLPVLPTHVTHTHAQKKKKKNALHSLYGHIISKTWESLKTTRKSPLVRTKKKEGPVCLSFLLSALTPHHDHKTLSHI